MADIFDKITGGFNKGVAVVGANSKAVVEKAKINTAIKNQEEEKRKLAELLGLKVYEIHMSGAGITGEDIEGFVDGINTRIQNIAEYSDQLEKIEAELRAVAGGGAVLSVPCAQCGNMNPQGAKFCAKCGNPQ